MTTVVETEIPVLISRSGTTEMGLDVPRRCGVTLIGRARNERLPAVNRSDRIEFSAWIRCKKSALAGRR